jgi:hypothetical protein
LIVANAIVRSYGVPEAKALAGRMHAFRALGALAYGVEMPALMMTQERREPAT